MTLKSSHIIVVGAAGGVGLEVAALLCAQGYSVTGTVLNDAEERRVRARLPDIANIAIIDLSDADRIEPTLAPILLDIGDQLGGAIVCAAKATHGPLEVAQLADLRLLFEVNVMADLAVYRACMPYLRRSRGRLVFLTSFGGRLAMPFIGHYVTTKFALEGLGDVMRREAAHFGVPVILVQPGGIRTAMVTDLIDQFDADIAALSPEHANLFRKRYEEYREISARSMKTVNLPEDIARITVDAFEDPAPKPRYAAGQDAVALLALARSATDEELDEFLLDMYSAQGTITDFASAAERSGAAD